MTKYQVYKRDLDLDMTERVFLKDATKEHAEDFADFMNKTCFGGRFIVEEQEEDNG